MHVPSCEVVANENRPVFLSEHTMPSQLSIRAGVIPGSLKASGYRYFGYSSGDLKVSGYRTDELT
jgi:hypothetical protein